MSSPRFGPLAGLREASPIAGWRSPARCRRANSLLRCRREATGRARLRLDSTTRLVFSICMDRRQRVTLLTEAALPDREHGVPSVLNAPTSPVGVTTVQAARRGQHATDAGHADQRVLALVRLLSDVLWREGQAHGPRLRGSRHDLHGPPSRRWRRMACSSPRACPAVLSAPWIACSRRSRSCAAVTAFAGTCT